jgi:hypothetical protein
MLALRAPACAPSLQHEKERRESSFMAKKKKAAKKSSGKAKRKGKKFGDSGTRN